MGGWAGWKWYKGWGEDRDIFIRVNNKNKVKHEKAESINLMSQNIVENLHNLRLGNALLDMTPKISD